MHTRDEYQIIHNTIPSTMKGDNIFSMDDHENNNCMEDIRAAKRLHFTIQDGDFAHTEDMGHSNDIVDDATNSTYGEDGRQRTVNINEDTFC